MNKKPMCSILTTTYNSAEFIEYTLHSVGRQTYVDFEMLIVDNNSTDNTAQIIETIALDDSRIKLYRSQENLWAFGGLNFLLDRAQGKYIAIIDHDDIWHPDKLMRQISFLEQNSSYVGCGSTFLDVWEWDNFGKYELFHLKNVVMHSSLVFRNKWYKYDNTLYKYSDREFMVHVLAKDGPIKHMWDIFLLRRIRRAGKNISTKWANLRWFSHSKGITGVSRHEFMYNFFRFRYPLLYKLALYVCMPWKVISLTNFVKKNTLRKPYADFVLKAFA